MKLFAAALIFAVALQGSVYARPEPFGLGDILSIFGVNPQNSATADSVVASIPAAITAAASDTTTTTTTTPLSPATLNAFYNGLAQGLSKFFGFFPTPKQAGTANPFYNIFMAFLASLQQTQAVTASQPANDFVQAVMDSATLLTTSADPIAAVLNSATQTAQTLLVSSMEVVPAFVTSLVFGAGAQTRDIYSFSLDVAAGLGGFVNTIQNWVVSTFNLGADGVAYLFSGLNLAINDFPIIVQNVTSIGTTQGFPGGMSDILKQIIAAADLIVDQTNKVINTIADTVITSTDGTVSTAISAVLGVVNPILTNAVSLVSASCAVPVTNTLNTLSFDVANAVEICARSEVAAWTGILSATSEALEGTNAVISGLEATLDSALRFDVWGVVANAWGLMGPVSEVTLDYGRIAPLATAAVGGVQTRFSTCLGIESGMAVVNATIVAAGIFTCL